MKHFRSLAVPAFFLAASLPATEAAAQSKQQRDAYAAMRRATTYYWKEVAVQGGYVYSYSLDLKDRKGEGPASPTEIWVQPPGTPLVGMAFVQAYVATKDEVHRDAAIAAAEALAYGQLQSGGWRYQIDFNPGGSRVGKYRNGKGGGVDVSTLDDDTTTSAIRFLMRLDHALEFKDPKINALAKSAIDALVLAQFPNGAFPQAFEGPASKQPVVPAKFPTYDWRKEGKIANYYRHYTLNDQIGGFIADTLKEAYDIYKDDRFMAALRKLGDFFILAQMPDPQPAWCQQYTFAMEPAWARRFEPPAVSGWESQDVMETLIKIYGYTKERKYLEPIPKALAYLRKSQLPSGQLARFYEVETNTPLYMTKAYELTYSDADLPTHYGFKMRNRLDSIEDAYKAALGGRPPRRQAGNTGVGQVIAGLDDKGRWVSGGRISSETFAQNMGILADFLTGKK